MANRVLQPQVWRALRDHVPNPQIRFVQDAGKDRPVVWQVGSGHERYCLKVYRSDQHFEQELAAYNLMGHPSDLPVPTLIHCLQGSPPALLMSWVDGEMYSAWCTAGAESRGRDLHIYKQAGTFLRRLHSIPVEDQDLNALKAEARAKINERSEALRHHLPAYVVDWACRLAASENWEQEIPVALCHHDFSPRNWIVMDHASSPKLAVIDFEHSRVDLRPLDAMKLLDGPFRGRPDRRQAFLSQYGGWTPRELEHLRLVAPIYGLAVVWWSHTQHNHEYFRQGRDFLVAAAENDDWMLS